MAHLVTSAPFRAGHLPVSGQLCGAAAEGGSPAPRFPAAFRPAGSRLLTIRSRRTGIGPSLRLAYRASPGPRRGFHVPHGPRPDRRGCPLNPEATVFSRPTLHLRPPLPLLCGRPYPQHCVPSPGAIVTRHQMRVSLALTRPIFPLPVAPVWSGRPWAFVLMLRTPPLPATHVREGTDHEHFSEAHCRLHPVPPINELTRTVRPRVAVTHQIPP